MPVDIAKAAVELGERSWNNLGETDARMRVNNHWKKLKALWDMRIQHLPERLRRDDVDAVPDIDKLDDIGGRNNKVRYRLQFFEAPQADVPIVTSPVRGRQVETGEETVGYYPVDLELPRFLRWIPGNGLVLSSGVGRLLVIFVTLAGVVGLICALALFFLLSYTLSAIAFLKLALAMATLVAILWTAFGWWWNLAQNRVARAPLWWQPIGWFGDNVIEVRMDPKGGTRPPHRLHLVRYVGDCPLCGVDGPGRSAVRLESGRMEFFGRIVGRCRHAPNEHVWSFDHVAQRGKALR